MPSFAFRLGKKCTRSLIERGPGVELNIVRKIDTLPLGYPRVPGTALLPCSSRKSRTVATMDLRPLSIQRLCNYRWVLVTLVVSHKPAILAAVDLLPGDCAAHGSLKAATELTGVGPGVGVGVGLGWE